MSRLKLLMPGLPQTICICCMLWLGSLDGICFAQTIDQQIIKKYRETIFKQIKKIEALEIEVRQLKVEGFQELHARKQKLLLEIGKKQKLTIELGKIAKDCCYTQKSEQSLHKLIKEQALEINKMIQEYKSIKRKIQEFKE